MDCSKCHKKLPPEEDAIEVLIQNGLEPSWKALDLSLHRHLNPTDDCVGDGKALARLTTHMVDFPNPA